MKARPHRWQSAGFTLLEALLAMFVFSIAVVSLVTAINTMGEAAVESRRELQIQGRMESLLMEATRSPEWLQGGQVNKPEDKTVKEAGVTYLIQAEEHELENSEAATLTDFYRVSILARWEEGGLPQEQLAETWVWPPLFAPTQQ
jgi:Tfp pilus assembly protein PilV